MISDFKIEDDQLREYGSIFTDIRRMFEDQAIAYENHIQIDNNKEE